MKLYTAQNAHQQKLHEQTAPPSVAPRDIGGPTLGPEPWPAGYVHGPESALLPWQPGPQHVEVSCIHLFAATQLLRTAQGQHCMWNGIGF